MTTRDFYPYQVLGAVGLHLKLYGRIDAGKLLRATSQTGHPRAAQIKEAASRLEDLLMHGAIMADDVGFGKTIMLLLAAFLHSVSTDEVEAGRILHRPILLVTPPALISQWVKEIRHEWPFFQAVISYEDHEFRETMALSSLSHSAMVELPSMETMPAELQFLWDTSNPAAGKAIVVTSYETHKSRTGIRRTKTIPGVPHRTPRFHANGEPIWKRPPKTTTYWTSNHEGRYALLIADEAQKIKNYSSGLWNVLYCHSMRKTLLATATPIFNSIKVSSSRLPSHPVTTSGGKVLFGCMPPPPPPGPGGQRRHVPSAFKPLFGEDHPRMANWHTGSPRDAGAAVADGPKDI